ncbi:hypothetical protein ABKA04_005650 [Annulohypoxylon sp. FPYF3050]
MLIYGAASIVNAKWANWQTLMTTSLDNIQVIHNVNIVDPELVPLQNHWINCSFMGRVCAPPQTAHISLRTNNMKQLLHYGFFVELQYFLNRTEEGPPTDMLKRGAYSFYVFVLFDDSAMKRHSWAINEGRLKLKEDQHVYCSGRIIGQLKQEYVIRAGYEADTISERCPIHMIVPSESLRAAPEGTSSQFQDTSSPEKTSIRTGLQARMMQSMKKNASRKPEDQQPTASQSTHISLSPEPSKMSTNNDPDIQLLGEQTSSSISHTNDNDNVTLTGVEAKKTSPNREMTDTPRQEEDIESEGSIADFIDDSDEDVQPSPSKRKSSNDGPNSSSRLRKR